MVAKIPTFIEQEMAINYNLCYPKAYSHHSNKSRSFMNPYINGHPLCFIPYTLQPEEALTSMDLNEMLHVVDLEATPSTNLRGCVNVLWEQLDHLGLRCTLAGHVGYVNTIAVSPDGSVCASGGKDGVTLLWDLAEGKLLYGCE